MIHARLLILMMISSLATNALADFKTGGDAYKSGDYATAAKEFLPLAESGDHRAMYALGSMYSAGHGVPQDYAQAFHWFQKAAQYGRPDAEYKLGLLYMNGLGTEQDHRKALNWIGRAARKKYPNAQFQIGEMYANGWGVDTDPVKAYAWYSVALAQGVTHAQPPQTDLKHKLTPEQLKTAEELSQSYQNLYGKY